MRIVIIGGGILGLAVARLLSDEHDDVSVTVLEKDEQLAGHQTATNSGVVHAGIYYEPGSLKARLCRRGLALLRSYCEERALPYEACGKLVIALREEEVPRLRELEWRARANGVPGLRMLDADGIRRVEPAAVGVAALHSPETAITDFREVARSFAQDVLARGGVVRTSAAVSRVHRSRSGSVTVELNSHEDIPADHVVVCSGLFADRLARTSGEPESPRIVPFRGEYWQLRADRRDLVRGLIYPVPDPRLPFLGVHLTRKVDGSVLIGPNAVIALAREGYSRRSFDPYDVAEMLGWPGTWRMMRTHWRVGAAELRRSTSKKAFIRDASQYVPTLRASDVVAGGSGVRAQAVDRDGSLVDDFRIGGDQHVTWVRNAPSPAATSSMAIAEEIVRRLKV
jgi:(S)-2-hydroxyglutarate dehydrogenase